LFRKGPFSGIGVAGIVGLRQAYPDLRAFLAQHLTAAGNRSFDLAATLCNPQDVSLFASRDIFSYFDIPDPLDQPVPSKVLQINALGSHTPTAPLYVYQSVNDEVVLPEDVDTLVNKYCSEGVDVEYRRDTLSEHVILVATGVPGDWLEDRFDGKLVKKGCDIATVASSLQSPEATQVLGSVIQGDLLALVGAKIGPTGQRKMRKRRLQ
jgi:hypothetical protein